MGLGKDGLKPIPIERVLWLCCVYSLCVKLCCLYIVGLDLVFEIWCLEFGISGFGSS